MAVKISNLPDATTLDGTEELPIVQDGETRKATSGAVGLGDSLPIGAIFPHAGTTAPAGALICDGAAVSRTIYADLFAVIGTTWGVGDGSNTFNLPDLRGAFLRGTGSHGTEQMADGNPFAGPAVGAFEDDQFQGHRHDLSYVSLVANNDTGSNWTGIRDSSPAGETDQIVKDPIDGDNGTVRTGDETRPFGAGVTYCIKATKAVNVPDISTIESYRYDSGWVANSDWTDATLSIAHALGAPLPELIVRFFISTDGTDANSFEVKENNYDLATPPGANNFHGYNLFADDDDTIEIRTSQNGITYWDGAAFVTIDNEAWYYRVVIYKPEVVAGFLPTTLTTWVYTTGWVANSDWTDMTLDIVHNLGASLPDLIVDFFVSGTADDDAAILIENHTRTDGSGSLANCGFQLQGIDANTIRLQSGADGFVYFNSAGTMNVLDTESWFYKFVIYKPEIVQQVQAVSVYDFNLSAENKSIVLPAAYPLNTDLTISWTGGDGTYTLAIDPDTGQTIDGDAAGVWEGEGEGRMVVQRVSSTLWHVHEYRDSDGGAFANGSFLKRPDGSVELTETQGSIDVSTASGQIFRSSQQTWTLPITVVAITGASIVGYADSIWGGVDAAPTTTQILYRLYAQVSRTGRTSMLTAHGTWK